MIAGYEEARLYHSRVSTGFVALCTLDRGKFRQEFCPRSDLETTLSIAVPTVDSYISQAAFRSPVRRFVTLQEVGVCYADLDTYTTEQWAGREPDHIAQALLLHCEDEGIPRPSVINYSGRGLQVKWLLDEPISGDTIPEWIATQRRLVTMLKEYGSDSRCAEPCRVLRLVGSQNSKSGQEARTLPFGSGGRWDFSELTNEVLSNPRFIPASPGRDMMRERREQEASDRQATPGGLLAFSPARLWCDRLYDLCMLARLRGWEESGAPQGVRHTLLFLAAVAVGHFVPADELETEIIQLHRDLCPTLPLREAENVIRAAVQRAQTSGNYRFSNETLIDWLSITEEEQTQLRTIIGEELAAERHRERNRKHSDRASYLEACRVRREEMHRLRSAGLTLAQIAQRMNCTINAVSKALRASVEVAE